MCPAHDWTLEKGKIFSSAECRNNIPRTSTLKYSLYTDYAIPALTLKRRRRIISIHTSASVELLYYMYLIFLRVFNDTLSM